MAHSPELHQAREHCANEVAEDLFALERSIEHSLATTAGVVAKLAGKREALGLSILHGQRLLNQTLELAGMLNAARESAGEVHKTAALTQRQVGVRTVAGNPGDKPDQTPTFVPLAAGEAPDAVIRRVA
jgi:hypothetical protein